MRLDLRIVAEDGESIREALRDFVEDDLNFRHSNACQEIPLKKGYAKADYDFTPGNDIYADVSQVKVVIPIPYPKDKSKT